MPPEIALDPTGDVTLSLAVASRALDALEEEVGGRAALIDALLYAPSVSSELNYLVGLIADPRSDTLKLSSLCLDGGLSIAEVITAFKKGVLAKAMIGAIRRVAEAAPQIVEDLVARSVVHEVDCGVCYGRGSTRHLDAEGREYEKSCGRCDGSGRVTADPDFARQKFVLTDLAGMGPQKSGPSVVVDQRQQTVNLGAGVTPQQYGQLLGGIDQLLYGRSVPALPASPLAPEPPSLYTAPHGISAPSVVAADASSTDSDPATLRR